MKTETADSSLYHTTRVPRNDQRANISSRPKGSRSESRSAEQRGVVSSCMPSSHNEFFRPRGLFFLFLLFLVSRQFFRTDDVDVNEIETGLFYVGWTEPTEYLRYSVDVAIDGK